MYCFKCDKITETNNEREEEWKGYKVLKGKCKVCNTGKVKKLYKKIRYDEKKAPLI